MGSLMLLRHAKTEDSRPGSPDRARRLTPEGRQQAAEVGDHLRREQVAVDLVVCSAAVRARQTVEALGSTAPVEVSEQLYNSGGDEILAVLRELDDAAEHVLVVGHAPGLPSVALELADPQTSDPDALATVERRFPSAALATMRFTGTWRDLDRATLVSVRLP